MSVSMAVLPHCCLHSGQLQAEVVLGGGREGGLRAGGHCSAYPCPPRPRANCKTPAPGGGSRRPVCSIPILAHQPYSRSSLQFPGSWSAHLSHGVLVSLAPTWQGYLSTSASLPMSPDLPGRARSSPASYLRHQGAGSRGARSPGGLAVEAGGQLLQLLLMSLCAGPAHAVLAFSSRSPGL